MKTNLREYWQSLTPAERIQFAKRAGTTPGYIQDHLIYARKVPRPALMRRLSKASGGAFSVQQLIEFFYE